MASTGAQVTGLKDLNRALKQLGGRTAEKAARTGIAKMAQVIRKEMRDRAPKDSGNLRDHIRYKIRKARERNGFYGRVGVMGGTKGMKKKDGYSGFPFYATFIEYGTAPHRLPSETVGRGRGKRTNHRRIKFDGKVFASVNHPGTRAQPFLRPAFEATKKRAVDEAAPRIWKEIEKQAKKQGKR